MLEDVDGKSVKTKKSKKSVKRKKTSKKKKEEVAAKPVVDEAPEEIIEFNQVNNIIE